MRSCQELDEKIYTTVTTMIMKPQPTASHYIFFPGNLTEMTRHQGVTVPNQEIKFITVHNFLSPHGLYCQSKHQKPTPSNKYSPYFPLFFSTFIGPESPYLAVICMSNNINTVVNLVVSFMCLDNKCFNGISVTIYCVLIYVRTCFTLTYSHFVLLKQD